MISGAVKGVVGRDYWKDRLRKKKHRVYELLTERFTCQGVANDDRAMGHTGINWI